MSTQPSLRVLWPWALQQLVTCAQLTAKPGAYPDVPSSLLDQPWSRPWGAASVSPREAWEKHHLLALS